jgi:hypothetical protein
MLAAAYRPGVLPASAALGWVTALWRYPESWNREPSYFG